MVVMAVTVETIGRDDCYDATTTTTTTATTTTTTTTTTATITTTTTTTATTTTTTTTITSTSAMRMATTTTTTIPPLSSIPTVTPQSPQLAVSPFSSLPITHLLPRHLCSPAK
uniref:Uncharacterized protein n=1 Tax=Octopus bimaculoides TaxID=37653 RepID=A0A0L8H8G6_OCTBM